MTPEQKAAIAAKLGVDLATLDSDRLIELCLLHRAQPKALESFPNALAAEINRRFTAAEIARDDVPYSVLQHFANQFTGAAPLFQRLMQEMAASINRDIWFTDNAEAFKAALANEEAAAWLAGQADILNKCLQNRLALGYIAQSTTTATAILTREEALALWKNAPALWDIWPQHAAGMQVLAKSGELVDYLFSIPAAVAAVQKQPVAIRALAANGKGVRHMATPDFMKIVIMDEGLRNAFIAQNDAFQSVREALFKAVSASGSGWVKAAGYSAVTTQINGFGGNFLTPPGLLFARFTRNSSYAVQANSRTTMNHPGGALAAAGQDNSEFNQGNLNKVDGISFNGATFQSSDYSNYLYAELWRPN